MTSRGSFGSWPAAVALAVAVACVSSADVARGQPAKGGAGSQQDGVSSADRAAAQALFDEGRELVEDERWKEACEKFDKSMKLDPAIGTQLNLAACYEKLGKTASAWINFIEAAALAKKRSDKRMQIAKDRAAALEPKLSKIKIVVPIKVEGLEITRSGEPVRAEQWGSFVPIDPGLHEIVATAPGKLPWRKKVTIGEEADKVKVTLGVLEDDPNAKKPETGMSPARLGLGIGAGVVGLAGIAVGSAFGVIAMGKRDDSLGECLKEDPNKCTAAGVTLRDEAITASHVSTVGFAVGGAALVGSLLVFLTAPRGEPDKPDDQAAWITPTIGEGFAGVSLSGRF